MALTKSSISILFFHNKGGASNPFRNLEKASVLQETRVFNETPINPKKCCHILTKILYMINQVTCNLIIKIK